MIAFDQTAHIPTYVLARPVGDELVLLDLASGTYFGLNGVGTRVWSLLESGLTGAQVCERLFNEFEVPEQTLRADVGRLLVDLSERRLLEWPQK